MEVVDAFVVRLIHLLGRLGSLAVLLFVDAQLDYCFVDGRAPPRCSVDLFVFGAPLQRSSRLFDVVGHRRAAAMGAGDDDAIERLLATTERGLRR